MFDDYSFSNSISLDCLLSCESSFSLRSSSSSSGARKRPARAGVVIAVVTGMPVDGGVTLVSLQGCPFAILTLILEYEIK